MLDDGHGVAELRPQAAVGLVVVFEHALHRLLPLDVLDALDGRLLQLLRLEVDGLLELGDAALIGAPLADQGSALVNHHLKQEGEKGHAVLYE